MDRKQAIRKAVANFNLAFCDMGPDELKETLEIVQSWSPSNCWYVEYYMKDSIIKIIESRLADFKSVKSS